MSALGRVMANPSAFPQDVTDEIYGGVDPVASTLQEVGGVFSSIYPDLVQVNRQFSDPTVPAAQRRNALEMALGTTNAVLGKPIGGLFSAVTPDFIEDASEAVFSATGIPQYLSELSAENPRIARGLEEASGTIPFLAAKPAQSLFARNLPNEMPGFYGESGLDRFKAISKGAATGFTNALKQAVSPELQAELRKRGVSKTATDVARTRRSDPKVVWGQLAYENLLGKMTGNQSPLLSRLDNDYFTHTGIFSPEDFRTSMGLNKQDADATFRTMQANWKLKPSDNVIMVKREPRRTEGSGDLQSAAFSKAAKARELQTLYPLDSGFTDADQFFRMYNFATETDGKESSLTADRRTKIAKAFRENPELGLIKQGDELAKELQKIVKFPTTQLVNRAVKYKTKGEFESNDALAKALEERGIKVNRNRDQKEDADVYFSDSVASDAMELGGVNIVYKVGKDGKVSAQVSDIQDLEGLQPGGSTKLIAITPPMMRDFAQPLNTKGKDTREKPTAVAEIVEELQTPATAEAQDVARAAGSSALLGTTAAGILAEDPFEEDPLAPSIR